MLSRVYSFFLAFVDLIFKRVILYHFILCSMTMIVRVGQDTLLGELKQFIGPAPKITECPLEVSQIMLNVLKTQ